MQVVRLFSSFTVLSNDIGFISVTRTIAENKSANATKPPKTRSEKTNFSSYVSDQISITALLSVLQPCKLYYCFRHSLFFRMVQDSLLWHKPRLKKNAKTVDTPLPPKQISREMRKTRSKSGQYFPCQSTLLFCILL